MNKDIAIMLEMQGFWNKVLAARSAIDRHADALRAQGRGLDAEKAALADSTRKITELKSGIKADELAIAEKSDRKKKLDDRKKIIATEKELQALEKEIDLLSLDIDALEDKTLGMIDTLDALEKQHRLLQESVNEKERSLASAAQKFEEEDRVHHAIIAENEEKFNSVAQTLGTLYRSRFLKIIKSRDGTAIARVEGEICGYCNFKIPSYLAIDAGKDDKVVACTNCGKFIYR